MSENVGAMRVRVRLESPTRTPDAMGGAALAWSNQGDVWAEVRAGGAGRSGAFDTAPSVTTYTMIIHRRSDVRAGWRVAWAARVFRIVAVRDEGAPRIELICEEEIL
jgi:head-tail adaptor